MSICLNAPSVRQEYVCQKDAATLMGRSVSYIQKLERAGNFITKFRVGNGSLYRLNDVRAWMEKHAQGVA